MQIAFADRASIELEGVTYILEYKLNLILLDLLWDNNITDNNNFSSILLIEDCVSITFIKKD